MFLSSPPEIILLGYVGVAPFQGAFPRVLIPRPEGCLKAWAIDRGRDKGALCPSLRTGLADRRHPALQLVVSFQEDRHAAVRACSKESKPTAEK